MALRLTRREALISMAAMAVVSCAPTPAAGGGKKADPFKFLFGFTVQANPSLPVIIAKEQGFYREQNIDINWDFSTDSASIRLIGAGQYQAGSVSDVAAVANFVNEGVPLKAIVQQGQASAKALAVKKGSGIKRPKDFEGKRVGIKAGSAWSEYLAMLAFDKVDRSKIKEVPVGFSSVELKDDLVDVMPVFTGNEPFTLRNVLKVDIDLLLPANFGYPAVGTTMVANTTYIKDNRDTMTRFLKATMKAQEFFIAERDKTIQIAIQYGGTATSKEQHAFIYDVSAPDMKHPKGVGTISKEAWQANLDLLVSLGVLKTKPKVEDLIDTSFMDAILKDGKVIFP